MKSLIIKRSVVIAGHKTSISLEDDFWTALKEIAVARGASLSDVISSIDAERQRDNLSSAIRLFVLDSVRSQHDKEARARRYRSAYGSPPRSQLKDIP
jgi:predicted DNA-binding ribbon-helix-helix protein